MNSATAANAITTLVIGSTSGVSTMDVPKKRSRYQRTGWPSYRINSYKSNGDVAVRARVSARTSSRQNSCRLVVKTTRANQMATTTKVSVLEDVRWDAAITEARACARDIAWRHSCQHALSRRPAERGSGDPDSPRP